MPLAFKFNPAKLRYEKAGKEVFGISLTRDIVGVGETIQVLEKLGHAINMLSARAVSVVIADLLAKAQPRVPVDTGKLRESGRGYLNFVGGAYKDIVWGNKDGTVRTDLSRLNKTGLRNIRGIIGNVSYSRIGDDGETDVAIYTHEELNPYGGESPRARTPGTGPKYLEIPFIENKDKYISFIKSSLSGAKFENELSKILIKRTKRIRGYTLDYVDITLDRIAFTGYFGELVG